MNRFVIAEEYVDAPKGLIVSNYLDNLEVRFNYTPRKRPLKHFVLHETAGRKASRCKRTLLDKGYGVHLIMARDGSVSCHGDLAYDCMIHANQLNKTSIGIEVVNPYAPEIAKGMNVKMIPADWWTWVPDKDDRRYVLPSQRQLDALVILVPWLCNVLDIPVEFPTAFLNRKNRKIKGWKKPPLGWRAKPKPGIVAHRDFAKHADGRYLLEYLMERI